MKYQKFTPPGCKDIGIIILKFVAKTQFLEVWKSKKSPEKYMSKSGNVSNDT